MTKQVQNKQRRQSTAFTVSGCFFALGIAGCGSGFHYVSPGSGSAPPPTSKQTVTAPANLGYAWDSSDRTLRPIQGVVGASHVGASVVQPAAYVMGVASAVSSIALLVRSDGLIDCVNLATSAKTTLKEFSVSPNSRVRFSASGTSAVLFVPGGSSVVLVTNLSDSPQAASLSTSSLEDAAVSDAGSVAALQQRGTASQLAILTQGGAQAVQQISGSGLLAFLPKSDSLLVVSSTANSVSLVRNSTTAPVVSQINTAGSLKAPIAVSVSQDAHWAAIANGGESSVVRLDLAGISAPQRLICPAQPTTAETLTANAAFRFSNVGSAPAWISDLSAAVPTMLFVPAVKS